MSKKSIISAIFLFSTIFFVGINTAQAVGCISLGSTLRYGSSGTSDVMDLQNFLFEKGYLTDNPTGFFGKLTQAAVKKFQKENGLPSTGIVANLTRGKISTMTCTPVAINTSANLSVNLPMVLGTSTSEVTPTPTPTPTPTIVVASLPYFTLDFSEWDPTYGTINFTSQGMELKASASTTVAISNFTRGQDLTDYRLTTNAFIKRGTYILMARYKDDQNYAACYFSGHAVEIVQKLNGEQTSLASTDMPDSPYTSFFFNDINVSMNVKGNKVGCTMLGEQDNVTANIDSSLSAGTFGVQVWYDADGVAEALVRSVKAEAI